MKAKQLQYLYLICPFLFVVGSYGADAPHSKHPLPTIMETPEDCATPPLKDVHNASHATQEEAVTLAHTIPSHILSGLKIENNIVKLNTIVSGALDTKTPFTGMHSNILENAFRVLYGHPLFLSKITIPMQKDFANALALISIMESHNGTNDNPYVTAFEHLQHQTPIFEKELKHLNPHPTRINIYEAPCIMHVIWRHKPRIHKGRQQSV